eukprot:7388485-Alexandrium_andersonii.AAC.1
MSASLVGSEMCIRDRLVTCCRHVGIRLHWGLLAGMLLKMEVEGVAVRRRTAVRSFGSAVGQHRGANRLK